MEEFDSPWKEALEHLLELFLAFCFPEIHAAIDWSRKYESLDTELQQIMHDAEIGRRLADKLFKVWLKDGGESFILIHLEAQNQRDALLPERMYVYNYRIFDKHRKPVVSLAILGDDDPRWRPSQFTTGLFGCQAGLNYLVVKLLDYAGRIEELEADPNPFAAVVLAHLKVLETRDDPASRRTWKSRLIKSLYSRGLTGEQIRLLFRVLDWMMTLPSELERE